MAICDLCNNEMTTGATCTATALHRDGTAFELPPFDPRNGWTRAGRCGDCNVLPGGHHHIGCDAQQCPRCGDQLVSCACRWSEDDLTPPPPPAPLRQLAEITGDFRVRYQALLRDLAAWSLSEGRSADLDLAALVVENFQHFHGAPPWALDRPHVEDLTHGFRPDGLVAGTFALPDSWASILIDLLRFLSQTGRIGGAPLEVLLEPLRCAAHLDSSGTPIPWGSFELEIPCQCMLPFDPALPHGVHQHFLGVGREGRRLAANGLVLRPSDDPPVSRLHPLHEYVAKLRADDNPWDVWTDELRYAGEVFPTKESPALSVYRLVSDPRGRWSPLLLDRSGDPWGDKPDGRRKVGYRWVRLSMSSALYRTGITDHIVQRRSPAPQWSWAR